MKMKEKVVSSLHPRTQRIQYFPTRHQVCCSLALQLLQVLQLRASTLATVADPSARDWCPTSRPTYSSNLLYHVPSVDDLPNHDELVIEMLGSLQVEEELGSVLSWSAVRKCNRCGQMLPGLALCCLIWKRVPKDRLVASAIFRYNVAALDDEVRHDAMKRNSLVVQGALGKGPLPSA